MLGDLAQEIEHCKAEVDDTKKKFIKLQTELGGVEEKLLDIIQQVETLEDKETNTKKLSTDEKDKLKRLRRTKERLDHEMVSLHQIMVSQTRYEVLLSNRITAMQTLRAATVATGIPTNAYQALAATLQSRVFRTSAKSHPKLECVNQFPHLPMKVQTLSFPNFLTMCEDDVTHLTQLRVNSSLKFRKDLATKAQNKIGIAAFVTEVMGTVYTFASDNPGIIEPSPYYSTGSFLGVGAPDGQLGIESLRTTLHDDGTSKELDEVENLTCVVEIETNNYEIGDLASKWCDFPCTTTNCQSERHKIESPSRQLYNYMLNNNVFFGILCTYVEWVGLIRDCDGNLQITPTLYFDQDQPLSVAQFLVLFSRMALKKELPIKRPKDGVLIECTGHNCQHNKVPQNCDVRKQPEKDQSGNVINVTPFSNHSMIMHDGEQRTRDNHVFLPSADGDALSVHDICWDECIANYRTGTTIRTSIQGIATVIKMADIVKHPDREAEIRHECEVYHRLRDLWGKNVPSLVSHGRMHENFICALATTDEGDIIQSEVKDESFIMAAKEALTCIHNLGVLHGDVRRENILRRSRDGAPIIIDFGMSQLAEPGSLSREERNRELRELEQALKCEL